MELYRTSSSCICLRRRVYLIGSFAAWGKTGSICTKRGGLKIIIALATSIEVAGNFECWGIIMVSLCFFSQSKR